MCGHLDNERGWFDKGKGESAVKGEKGSGSLKKTTRLTD